MKLVFTKGRAKADTLRILRPHGSETVIQCPKQRIIPHDLVHYAVEQELGADGGFLSRVARGEGSGLRMDADPASDAIERLVAVVSARTHP